MVLGSDDESPGFVLVLMMRGHKAERARPRNSTHVLVQTSKTNTDKERLRILFVGTLLSFRSVMSRVGRWA